MATSTEEHYSIQYLSLIVGAGLYFPVAQMIHSFIAVLGVCDWLKGIPMTAVDQIITFLGIFRVISQLSDLVNSFLQIFPLVSLVFRITFECFLFLEISTYYCCVSLSALLVAVYCLKICNFHNVIFQTLKTFISQKTFHLILAIVLVSVVHAALLLWDIFYSQSNNSTIDLVIEDEHQKSLKYMYYFILGNAVPFLVQLFSSSILIASLYLHLRRMKSSNNLSAQLDPFYNIIKSTTFCFLSYFLQVVTGLFKTYYYNELGIALSYVLWNVFPCLHSIYLIHTITRLRNHFSRMLQCGTNCLFKKRDPKDLTAAVSS